MVFKIRKTQEQPVQSVQTPQVPVPTQSQSQNPVEDTIEDAWVVQETPRDFSYHVENKETGEKLDVLGALVKILNILDRLEKN